MSFLIKQAINSLASETSDIQVVLNQKADASQIYTKFNTYSTTEVDAKFTNLIDSAPATLNTLRELSAALNDDSNFASTVAHSLGEKQLLLTYDPLAAGVPVISGNAVRTVFGASPVQVLAWFDPFEVGGSHKHNNIQISMDSTYTSALASKAPTANPSFTGTVSGIDKTMVGLGNLDNTTDLLKPVSTATKTALDAKAPIANPTFTGTSFTTSGLLTCGNISTGPTSLSIITPSNDQVAVFTVAGSGQGKIEFWGDVTCLGDLNVDGLLFGAAFDFKLQPYALAADYSTTSSIASTYQKNCQS